MEKIKRLSKFWKNSKEKILKEKNTFLCSNFSLIERKMDVSKLLLLTLLLTIQVLVSSIVLLDSVNKITRFVSQKVSFIQMIHQYQSMKTVNSQKNVPSIKDSMLRKLIKLLLKTSKTKEELFKVDLKSTIILIVGEATLL